MSEGLIYVSMVLGQFSAKPKTNPNPNPNRKGDGAILLGSNSPDIVSINNKVYKQLYQNKLLSKYVEQSNFDHLQLCNYNYVIFLRN